LFYPVAAKDAIANAAFIARSIVALAWAGSCRFKLAPKCVSATAFAEAGVAIASQRGAAAHVRSRRNAAKSSWRRAVSLGGFEVEVEWSGTRWEFIEWDQKIRLISGGLYLRTVAVF